MEVITSYSVLLEEKLFISLLGMKTFLKYNISFQVPQTILNIIQFSLDDSELFCFILIMSINYDMVLCGTLKVL